MAMSEEIKMVMVVSMVVWGLVQETLKAIEDDLEFNEWWA